MTANPQATEPTITIALVEASSYHRDVYGITHRSERLYPLVGKAHNREAAHQVQVWDNTVRPNTGGTAFYRRGDGAYVAPNGYGTDERTSITLVAQGTVIANTHTASSLPHGTPLCAGSRLRLVWPDGTSGVYELKVQSWCDPMLAAC